MNPYEKMSMEEMEIVYQAYVKQNKINSFFQCYVERLKSSVTSSPVHGKTVWAQQVKGLVQSAATGNKATAKKLYSKLYAEFDFIYDCSVGKDTALYCRNTGEKLLIVDYICDVMQKGKQLYGMAYKMFNVPVVVLNSSETM